MNNLQQASELATIALSNFASKPHFWQDFDLAFGDSYDRSQAEIIRQEAINGNLMLPIRVVDDAAMGVAVGAFAAATNTIYLRESLVAKGSPEFVGSIIVEELGHSIDSRVNQEETPGDEGAIFRLLVGGSNISVDLLAELNAEDDWGTILVDGQELLVEMATTPTEGDDILTGDALANSINGLGGNDLIYGLEGNDSLYGGIGNDSLYGGLGNDFLNENIGANLLSGEDGDDEILTQSNINSTINGGNGNDKLFNYGGSGNVFDGGFGDDYITDTIVGFSSPVSNHDTINGAAGNDTIFSYGFYHLVNGGDGNDRISSSGDNSVINGGNGDDIIAVSGVNNVINGGDGNDLIDVGGNYNGGIYNGGIGDDTINNNNRYATIDGGDGNDNITNGGSHSILNGGKGNDSIYSNMFDDYCVLNGGAGDDVYNFSNSTTTIVEDAGAGTDTVWAEVNYSLTDNIETLLLVGSINGNGNNGNNTIVGYGVGNNIINGLGGNDTIYGSGDDSSTDTFAGGTGDDVYAVYNSSTLIVEDPGAGTDAVWAAVNYTLTNDVEILYLSGVTNGTGNASDNIILGYGAGNNVINGLDGNDTLNGGIGSDTLTGGNGADTFRFQFGQSSNLVTDRVTDFTINTDKISIFSPAGVAALPPTSFSRAANDINSATLLALAQSVYIDANGALAGNQALATGGAVLVASNSAAIAGIYLVIDDGIAGFSSNDLVVNITGLSGALPSFGAVPINTFF